MKKLLVIALLSSCMYSCSSEDMIYSCDPDIDKWTKENLSEISAMNRNDLLLYRNEVTLQRSIYAALNPAQKKQVWEEKILEVLNLSWAEKERQHIVSLLNIIHKYPEFFDANTHSNQDGVDLISYKWIKYAEEELNWKDDIIYAIAMTVNPINVINGNVVIDENVELYPVRLKTRSESIKLDCACHTTSGITVGACPSGYTCVTGNCTKVRNCGLLHASQCVGLCRKN